MGSRVGTFLGIGAEGLSLADLEVRRTGTGDTARAVLIFSSLVNELRPHLLCHAVARYLADRGMPEELLQQFLSHEHAQDTQINYSPEHSRIKESFDEAMVAVRTEEGGSTPSPPIV